jgi:hypothetical protein
MSARRTRSIFWTSYTSLDTWAKRPKNCVEERQSRNASSAIVCCGFSEGEVHAVIRGLRRMASLQKLPAEKRVDVDKARHDFESHADRMKYQEYLSAGLPTATGVIERACRHLVKDRLERTDMR